MKQSVVFPDPFNKTPPSNLPAAHQAALLSVKRVLTICQYSCSTIKSYCYHLALFFRFYREKTPGSLRCEEVRVYLRQQIRRRKWAEATQQQALNAIHFYFAHILGRCPDFVGLRPRTFTKLPVVLSRPELADLFGAVDNVKHRSMLMLIYSAGLRLNELTGLRRADIHFERKRVFVEGKQGKKDRHSLLSEKMSACLREYLHEYHTRYWLYEGRDGGPYSGRSVEAIFQRAALKAGLKKTATVRTLRHSFAAHLIEQGADIHYVRDLLGHESLKTTGIYTHLVQKADQHLVSPLDGPDW